MIICIFIKHHIRYDFMINITHSMILCVLFIYHISCRFPAAQIRFLAEQDLLSTPRCATTR
ncbi:hypothetical protein BWJ02_26980 [Salmonella enterica]|nr:hypothetical protein [Salmonella enterica]